MRALVIDDDVTLLELLQSILKEQLFAVDAATFGEQGSYLARTNAYDLIVLDLGLPDRTGRQVCKEIREAGKKMPIIILTADASTEAKIDLLSHGADDYITKPFSVDEFQARIKAVLRRSTGVESPVLHVGDLKLDAQHHIVMRKGKEIHLTRKEFMLLQYLMENAGKILSRGMILEHVWDMHADVFSNTIETHIHHLRSKVDHGHKKKLLKTISGRGYKIG